MPVCYRHAYHYQRRVEVGAVLGDGWALDSDIPAPVPIPPSPLAPSKRVIHYGPAKDTAGKYLRATVTYTDEHGDDKTAMAVSAHAVRAVPAGGNAAPKFPDANNWNRATAKPEVNENSPPGTNVGKPVTGRRRRWRASLTYTIVEWDKRRTCTSLTGPRARSP